MSSNMGYVALQYGNAAVFASYILITLHYSMAARQPRSSSMDYITLQYGDAAVYVF